LLRLVTRPAQSNDPSTAINFPLTWNNVADMRGATLHTASRILTAWEKAGLIASQRQRLTIRDRDGLQRIAEDHQHSGEP
jgi:CRP-like cAMP-binding protein